jgi:acyl dehydratase
MQFASFDELRAHVGQEIALSDWFLITQERVNQFADVTNDPDWMHIDVERAQHGPVGQTIVQGFLTLSLLTYFTHRASYLPKEVEYAFNYGLDRVRWITPVPVGKRIRNRMTLKQVTSKGAGRYLLNISNTVEIEDEPRPAMVAQWLGLVQASTGNPRSSRWP